MDPQEPHKDRNEHRTSKFSPQDKKKLEKFLSSLCESKGMAAAKPAGPVQRKPCRCPCEDAEWRAQLDIPDGVLCVYSRVTRQEADGPHRDITIAVTFVNDRGQDDYADLTFCDSEVRWLMEALWHAPIWD